VSLAERAGRVTPRGAILGVLWLQVGIALFLFGGDLLREAPSLLTGDPRAPDLTAPVHPGDQTRRYRPGTAPDWPATPARPYPAPEDMPERLAFALREIGGAEALTITGAIEAGDAGRFAAWRETNDVPAQVYLNSPGGSVRDALEIGAALREGGVTTHVSAGDICLSACPYLFAAGVERIADAAGAVGVHQHYFDENTLLPAFVAVEDIQRGQAQVVGYLSRMGVDLRIMEPALATPPDEIYILLPEELEDYALATEVTGQGGS